MRVIPVVLAAIVWPLVSPEVMVAQEYATDCQKTDQARAVCALEAALTEALRHNDATKLVEFYAHDFLLINYRGREVEKQGVLTALRTGTLRFDSLTTSELRLRLFDSAAVITGRQRQVAREPGADDQAHPSDVRFTHVYVRRGGRWLLMSTQITPILASGPR